MSEVAQSCPTLCDPMDCSLTRSLRPWDFPGKNTGVGCHFLLQEIFPTQGLNPGLLHCRQTLYGLSDCSLWRHTKEITGQIPLCHHSCSLASITLLSRVGMIKLIVFVFQGFLYFKGVVGLGAPGPLLARPGRSSPVHPEPRAPAGRICPGEFLTGSPHPSAGKTYPRRLHFHNNPNGRSPGEANVCAGDILSPLK